MYKFHLLLRSVKALALLFIAYIMNMFIVYSVTVVIVMWWAWTTLKWVWLKPKMLECYLRVQGLTGAPYKPLIGDLRSYRVLMKARSKPINLTEDIIPRVMPVTLNMLQTHGRTFFTWLGPIPIITIMDPEQIKQVFNRVYDFHKPHTSPSARLIATGLVFSDGDKWAKHRRIINPAFHREKIKNMVPSFYKSCVEVVREWEKLVSDDGSSCEVDVWPWLVNLSADVISRTAFGSSYKEGQRIFQLQSELAQIIVLSVQKTYIPGWQYLPTKSNRRMIAIDREIQAILRKIISKLERAREVGEAPSDDLLGILLESNLGQAQGDGMSIEDVMEECKLFYIAGQETTSALLVWTMVMLSQHQEWQSRAREEVKQVFGNKEPDIAGMNQLKVMTMILYEVLRLYTPVIQLNRAIHKEMKLGDLTLPGGVHVSLPILLVQRDSELWGNDAAEFKPERFKDGLLKATKNQVSFFPFGWGPRICIGQKVSLLEAKMAMALILQRFSFKLSPSYVHAPYTVITLHPQFGAHLLLHQARCD
uniref:Cytochrome P450 72A13 n=1 Tax=Isatis tinctoria TaxID=161756 RepID=A0A8F0FT25_ISATI|nr:cytochrome P450 72A13 [Isatis tinctoria]